MENNNFMFKNILDDNTTSTLNKKLTDFEYYDQGKIINLGGANLRTFNTYDYFSDNNVGDADKLEISLALLQDNVDSIRIFSIKDLSLYINGDFLYVKKSDYLYVIKFNKQKNDNKFFEINEKKNNKFYALHYNMSNSNIRIYNNNIGRLENINPLRITEYLNNSDIGFILFKKDRFLKYNYDRNTGDATKNIEFIVDRLNIEIKNYYNEFNTLNIKLEFKMNNNKPNLNILDIKYSNLRGDPKSFSYIFNFGNNILNYDFNSNTEIVPYKLNKLYIPLVKNSTHISTYYYLHKFFKNLYRQSNLNNDVKKIKINDISDLCKGYKNRCNDFIEFDKTELNSILTKTEFKFKTKTEFVYNSNGEFYTVYEKKGADYTLLLDNTVEELSTIDFDVNSRNIKINDLFSKTQNLGANEIKSDAEYYYLNKKYTEFASDPIKLSDYVKISDDNRNNIQKLNNIQRSDKTKYITINLNNPDNFKYNVDEISTFDKLKDKHIVFNIYNLYLDNATFLIKNKRNKYYVTIRNIYDINGNYIHTKLYDHFYRSIMILTNELYTDYILKYGVPVFFTYKINIIKDQDLKEDKEKVEFLVLKNISLDNIVSNLNDKKNMSIFGEVKIEHNDYKEIFYKVKTNDNNKYESTNIMMKSTPHYIDYFMDNIDPDNLNIEFI